MLGLFVIMIVFAIIGGIVQRTLMNKFKRYSNEPFSAGLSGAQVAERMLLDNGIQDVTIQSVQGRLTDHYNPMDKTINLSPEVFQGRSVAAAAVAAHETGHAIQHATSYSMLQLRSRLVPIVSISSSVMKWVFIAAIFGFFSFASGSSALIIAAIAAQAMITLFAVVTLPVEFDASKRALVYLENSGMMFNRTEHAKAKDALKWAGMTYMVSALASLTQLLYFVFIFLGRR